LVYVCFFGAYLKSGKSRQLMAVYVVKAGFAKVSLNICFCLIEEKQLFALYFLSVLFLGCFFGLGFDSFAGSVNNSL
jgi:hypothetical protein